MASVSLTRVIEKMKLENLTPEIDVKHVKITQPDINRPHCSWQDILSILMRPDCRLSDLWNTLIWKA